jgi:hypothetical protein
VPHSCVLCRREPARLPNPGYLTGNLRRAFLDAGVVCRGGKHRPTPIIHVLKDRVYKQLLVDLACVILIGYALNFHAEVVWL